MPLSPTHKRLIVCCDGTWQDGLAEKAASGYTNVLRIARAIEPLDKRGEKPVHQVTYYQSGVGSDPASLLSHAQGLTGAGLATKVEEAYSFITSNWVPGDEIFFVGFSRGAYTVRQVAHLIDSIGILSPVDMENFPALFMALQKEGKKEFNDDPEDVKKKNIKLLKTFRAKAQAQMVEAEGGWLVKAIGVFDTVGALGLPVEITLHKNTQSLLGFNDCKLGASIQNAFQALALNETRNDFIPTKWEMQDLGLKRKQNLSQVWFIGAHTDVGGGNQKHDLADLTLSWMISNLEEMLAINHEYINSIPDPVAPWGEQPPHKSTTGLFALASTSPRAPPTAPSSFPTFESIHPSVRTNLAEPSILTTSVISGSTSVHTLLSFEESVRRSWRFEDGYRGGRRKEPKDLGTVMSEMGTRFEPEKEEEEKVPNGGTLAFEDSVLGRIGSLLKKVGIRTSLGSKV